MAKKAKQATDMEAVSWSALVVMVGALIAVTGASLRNSYSPGTSYADAVHIRVTPSLLMVIGAVVAIVGIIGIVRELLPRSK